MPASKYTDQQFYDEWVRAFNEGITLAALATRLGIGLRNVQYRRDRLRAKGFDFPDFNRTLEQRKAALSGWSPQHDMTHTVPDGYLVKGVSTLYDANGAISAQWVKSTLDHDRLQAILAAAAEAWAGTLPQITAKKSSGKYMADLMACYPIGDAHIGMHSWAIETGRDWDLAIAERTQCGAMAALVDGAPAAEYATIVNLGDWLHYDSMAPVTAKSGHMLDADGRYAKMISIGIKVMRQCIESALTKHKSVRVINAIGNHDETGALWLSVALKHVYENEPRVIVDTSPSVFTYFEFGSNLIGVHHGHSCKADKLPGVMAADRAEAWGRTKHRYWWMGHIHNQTVKEFSGVTVESFNTLAANDSYASAGGWRSRALMKCIILHREYGEVARQSVHPDMLLPAES